MNESEPRQPTVGALIGGTFRTADYENIKIDVWLSSVPINCSDEYLREMLVGANVTIERVVGALAEELAKEVHAHVGERR